MFTHSKSFKFTSASFPRLMPAGKTQGCKIAYIKHLHIYRVKIVFVFKVGKYLHNVILRYLYRLNSYIDAGHSDQTFEMYVVKIPNQEF